MAFRASGEVAPPTLVGSARFTGQFSSILRVLAGVYDASVAFVLIRLLILGSQGGVEGMFGLAAIPASLVLTVMLLALMAATGMFRRWHAERPGQLLIRIAASQGGAVAVFIAGLVVLGTRAQPQELISFAFISVVLMTAGRVAYTELTAAPSMRRAVLLVGTPADTSLTAARLSQDVYADTVCAGMVTCGAASSSAPEAALATPTGTEILRSADLHGAKEIVVVSPFLANSLVYDALLQCRFAGLRVRSILQESERQRGEIDPVWFAPGLLAYGPGFGFASPWYRSVKRLVDIVTALILLVLVAPLCAIIALAIRLDDRGPVLYRQRRVGLGGRTFMLLKFRSMRVDAEGDGVARWADSNDRRITRVGRFLRRSRFDELPQLINVMRGEMSLIGPRPERPELTSALAAAIPNYDFRHVVQPGITGWAQVNFTYAGSIEDARRKLAYDLYYVKNCSLFLDLLVLVQTVRVVLWPDGVR